MRLGEVKNILDTVLDDENKLLIENEQKYGGQANHIKNFGDLFAALELLLPMEWNDVDSTQISTILEQYRPAARMQEISQEEFQQLQKYVNALNNKLPFFYSILNTMVEDQNERTINIQIPSTISDLAGLSSLNNRLEKIFKELNVDGQFEFRGFDKGSWWYIVIPAGVATYHCTIACLKIAQEFLKTKTEYFKSEEARTNYEASLEDVSTFKEEGFVKWQEKYMKLYLDKKVKEAVDAVVELNGHTGAELQLKLVRATKDLIEELKEGTEFHLSLNPPSYAKEQAGMIKIDYKKMKELNVGVAKKAVKQIEAPSEEKRTDVK